MDDNENKNGFHLFITYYMGVLKCPMKNFVTELSYNSMT